MIHLVIGGAIMIGASVVAWHFNQETEGERRRQQNLLNERDRLRRNFENDQQDSQGQFTERQRMQAQRYRTKLLEQVEVNREKIAAINASYRDLFKIVNEEVQAESTSPFRRSALKRAYAQFEDDTTRLVEYEAYLNYERDSIEKLWQENRLVELLEKTPSASLLPDCWLYPGKLIALELSEIDKRLPEFGHMPKLQGFDDAKTRQQALAIGYGESFPFLVTKQAKHEVFLGCVARGISFYDHIKQGEAIDAVIDHRVSSKKAYKCLLHGGLIEALVPEANLVNSALSLIPGQRITLYFDSYDATLTYNPAGPVRKGARRPPAITMSERKPACLEHTEDTLSLYIEIESHHLSELWSEHQRLGLNEASFYDPASAWTLMQFDPETNQLSLGKAHAQLHCVLSAGLDGLEVIKVEVFSHQQVGIDLPFEFILAEPHVEPNKYFGWRYGIEQLLNFSSQVINDEVHAKARLNSLRFFKRWQQVIDYQRRAEHERHIEVELTPERIEYNLYRFLIPKELYQSENDNVTLATLLLHIESEQWLNKAQVCTLQLWEPEQARFIPAVIKSKRHEARFDITSQGIEVEAHLEDYKRIDFSQPTRFKFTVSLPDSALKRQEQALIALMDDRLVEPRLKDIFLSPSHYQPETYSFWKEEPIEWSRTLTPSQEISVRKALSAKHLAMIQGPPGTGKTTTIVELLYQLLKREPDLKILVASQQNTAVDNALSKFKTDHPELIQKQVTMIRVGNVDKIDDDIVSDHFDTLFDEFLTDLDKRAETRSASLSAEYDAPAYAWRGLLQQMRQSIGSKRVSDEFFTTMLSDKNLIGATCVGLAARKGGIDHMAFDIAIVDEAGRATVPELLIPLLRAKKAVLIGDHHQLPPSVAPVLRDDTASQELEFLSQTFLEKSFFEHLFEQLSDECTATLTEQFRMAPPIGDLVADLFYTEHGVRKLTNALEHLYDPSSQVSPDCIRWFNIQGKEAQPEGSTTYYNEKEAQAIYEFLQEIAGRLTRNISVAVITPYGGQKRLLRQKFKHRNKLGHLSIKIDTVDSFQGSEAELVCYSTVRTRGSIQFLLDKKRLNVACSRAKENLVFFGNQSHMLRVKSSGRHENLFPRIVERAHVE
jgi:hypothetical protein